MAARLDDVLTLERIEAEAWADFYLGLDRAVAARLKPAVERAEQHVAIRLTAVDAALMNRAVWLTGSDPSKSAAAVDASLRDFFDAHGVSDYRLAVAPALGHFDVEGFERVGEGWGKFRWPGGAPPPVETSLRIEEVGAEGREDFTRAVMVGFGLPELLREWIGSLPGRARWRSYVAYDRETPVAAAASFIAGEGAWLGFGATLPDARNKGAQGALLARRVADALDAGATTIGVETGAPGPDGPGPSWRNIERVGFELEYVRPNWRRVR